MVARTATWLAIVVGGVVGAFAALFSSKPKPQIDAQVTAARSAIPRISQSSPSRASAVPRASAQTMTSASPSATTSSSAAESAQQARPAEDSITTERELRFAAIKCDEKHAEQCMRAAVAYETGSAGPKSPEQAELFRRRARTSYVQHCERGVANACRALIRVYRTGVDVEPNARLVAAFERRLQEICAIRTRTTDGCTQNLN